MNALPRNSRVNGFCGFRFRDFPKDSTASLYRPNRYREYPLQARSSEFAVSSSRARSSPITASSYRASFVRAIPRPRCARAFSGSGRRAASKAAMASSYLFVNARASPGLPVHGYPLHGVPGNDRTMRLLLHTCLRLKNAYPCSACTCAVSSPREMLAVYASRASWVFSSRVSERPFSKRIGRIIRSHREETIERFNGLFIFLQEHERFSFFLPGLGIQGIDLKGPGKRIDRLIILVQKQMAETLIEMCPLATGFNPVDAGVGGHGILIQPEMIECPGLTIEGRQVFRKICENPAECFQSLPRACRERQVSGRFRGTRR